MVNYEKIAELFQNEAFNQKANECKTMEDFQKLFATSGIEISIDETVDLISKIAEAKEKADSGELAVDELDNVAGGIVLSGTLAVLACVGIGVVAVGAAAGAAYTAYQALRWGNKHNC